MRYTVHAALPSPDALDYEALATAERKLAEVTGGFGRYSAQGAWLNDDNFVEREPGVTWEVLSTEVSLRAEVLAFAARIRDIFDQTEVLVYESTGAALLHRVR